MMKYLFVLYVILMLLFLTFDSGTSPELGYLKNLTDEQLDAFVPESVPNSMGKTWSEWLVPPTIIGQDKYYGMYTFPDGTSRNTLVDQTEFWAVFDNLGTFVDIELLGATVRINTQCNLNLPI